eukprot:s422_g40.t2
MAHVFAKQRFLLHVGQSLSLQAKNDRNYTVQSLKYLVVPCHEVVNVCRRLKRPTQGSLEATVCAHIKVGPDATFVRDWELRSWSLLHVLAVCSFVSAKRATQDISLQVYL